MSHHSPTISHSAGQTSAAGIPGRYSTASPRLSTAAAQPTTGPAATRNGRGMSGSRRRSTRNDRDTRKNAITMLTPPASTSHTSICRPNSGAIIDRPPTTSSAWVGVR
jgi:hypothetical protein